MNVNQRHMQRRKSGRRAKRRVRQYRAMCCKPQDIVAFLTVMEAGGLSPAPRRGFTKSVASKRISCLEDELAATLLRRWTNLDTSVAA
jgi:hypothetical protein